MPGVHFIFATVDRELKSEEVDGLCEKYFELHRKIALPDEALFVDLRPAFSTPLADITPETFVGVPIGYTPTTI